MKKLLCFLLCIFLLHGCESKKEVENEIPDFYGFKSKINTTMNDVKISADVKYESFDKLVLTFLLPETVNGMKIVLENGEYTLTYDDLVFSLSEASVPFSMFCEMIKTCGNGIKSSTNQDNIYTFTSDGHIYKLMVDDTNKFQKLVVDETYTVYFEDFQYIMGQTE